MEPLIAVAGLAAVVTAAVALVATAREVDATWLPVLRWAATALSAAVISAGAFDRVSRWALAVACVALVISVQALVLGFAAPPSLRRYLGRRDAWREFERGFERYTSSGRREANPLQRAVTRRPRRQPPERPPSATEVPR